MGDRPDQRELRPHRRAVRRGHRRRVESPAARGLLDAFASLLGGGARVADVGCGPGHVTTYLAGCGLAAYGVDLSPGMVAVARSRYLGLEFEVGSMLAPDVEDGVLDGALAWFCVIHLDDDRPLAYAELARAVRRAGGCSSGSTSPASPSSVLAARARWR